MPFHDVKQGETLMALAAQNGLESYQTILDRSENAELKEQRTDPGILMPGDQVFIPNKEMAHEPGAVDARHSFSISRPTAFLRLSVHDAEGAALAGASYKLEVEGQVFEGQMPDGVLEKAVSVYATAGELQVWPAGAADPEVWALEIGSMDPLQEISGVQARLHNLGYLPSAPSGEIDDATEAAIRAFQVRVGLEASGQIDDLLRSTLQSYYEPTADERQLEVEPEAGTEDAQAAEAGTENAGAEQSAAVDGSGAE